MPPLWKPERWTERLAELEARSGDLKEAPLRRDVRSLGLLLGRVLREQAGDKLYQKVEDLRQPAIRRRELQSKGQIREAEDLMQLAVLAVNSMPVDQADQLSRAFAFYFELINLAETNHRKRRRLSLQITGDSSKREAQRGELRGTLRAMREAGLVETGYQQLIITDIAGLREVTELADAKPYFYQNVAGDWTDD